MTEDQPSSTCLFVAGSPLLDISGNVSEEFCQKLNLELDRATLIGNTECVGLLTALEQENPVGGISRIPGGSGLNSARFIRELELESQQDCVSVCYVGSVGQDEHADVLRQSLDTIKMEYVLPETEDYPTGTCVCCAVGKYRSLAAHLAAATQLKPTCIENPAIQDMLEKSVMKYFCGFLVSDCYETAVNIMEIAKEKNSYFSFNLSSPFICSAFSERILSLVKHADFLFGNREELTSLYRACVPEDKSAKPQTIDMINWLKEHLAGGCKTSRQTIVITDGSSETFHITIDNDEMNWFTVPVVVIKSEDIVDSNGCGDAFVAAYLRSFLHNSSRNDLVSQVEYEKMVNEGHDAAGRVLRSLGATLAE